MATFRSNSYDGRQLRLEVWQDGGYLKWTLYSEGGNTQFYTISNLSISIAGTNVYSPGTVSWSTQRFPAANGSTGGSVWVGHSASYREFYVSFIGAVYYNRSTQNGGNVGVGATISKPSLSGLSVSSISDKSAYLSFNINSANNGTVSSSRIDLSLTNFGSVVKSISSRAGTISGLDPNRTYYARGSAANQAGRSYTSVKSFKTTFVNPGAPGKPSLTYNQPEPIPRAKITGSWNAGTAGSTAVAGYRVRLYKNGAQVEIVDTDSANTSYTFPKTLEEYGFEPGDVLAIGIYAYSKDWQGTKFFNGGGASTAIVMSDNLTIVSDKYIWVSVNGQSFNKHKMYVSINGGSFQEVRKEKFKVIK